VGRKKKDQGMKIYTRDGDKGKTTIIGGYEVDKDDIIPETLGAIDELNSNIGVLFSNLIEAEMKDTVRWIQERLYRAMSCIANSIAVKKGFSNCGESLKTIIEKNDTKYLEEKIDLLDESLPELTGFIQPGGTSASAYAHVCRSVCRRAERRLVELSRNYQINQEVLKFFNRLSDLFFTIARYLDDF
jgi:cob(I)alamin adenosyltransferase